MRRGAWCCMNRGCISMIDDRKPMMDLADNAPEMAANARNMSPIVPRGSIAGRALIAVVAIMTFLASMTTGAVLLVRASAAEWQSDVASELTIQLRPSPGRDIERDVRAVVDAARSATDQRVFPALRALHSADAPNRCVQKDANDVRRRALQCGRPAPAVC